MFLPSYKLPRTFFHLVLSAHPPRTRLYFVLDLFGIWKLHYEVNIPDMMAVASYNEISSPHSHHQGSTTISTNVNLPDTKFLDETIEVGDRIYATILCLPPTVAEIQASQTTSQHLAEAFTANLQPKPFCSTVLNHLYDFENVFSKASFDLLLECKQYGLPPVQEAIGIAGFVCNAITISWWGLCAPTIPSQ
ncbi:hypothetical protein J132_08636 [Termitomyces sp. J132]|nr:hypothetical protein J132_08636 [Termitomyces sp. J132]